jgi:hypothetical protein
MNAERTKDGVVVRFDYHEAVVLSEMLLRWSDNGFLDNPDPFEDDSEAAVLHLLAGTFEPMIDEAFSPEYTTILDGARAAVRG